SVNTLTIQLATDADLQHVRSLLNGLPSPAPSATPPVIVINLLEGSFTDLPFHLAPGVTVLLVGDGRTTLFIQGSSPALTLSAGTLGSAGISFTTSTDSATILVTGGNLILRNDVIEESAGFNQAAISVAGGTVDLGT